MVHSSDSPVNCIPESVLYCCSGVGLYGNLAQCKDFIVITIKRVLRWCRAMIRQASAVGHVAATQFKVMQASRVVLSFSSTRSRVGLLCLELCRKQGYRMQLYAQVDPAACSARSAKGLLTRCTQKWLSPVVSVERRRDIVTVAQWQAERWATLSLQVRNILGAIRRSLSNLHYVEKIQQ